MFDTGWPGPHEPDYVVPPKPKSRGLPVGFSINGFCLDLGQAHGTPEEVRAVAVLDP
jgi:hypothetical protein